MAGVPCSKPRADKGQERQGFLGCHLSERSRLSSSSLLETAGRQHGRSVHVCVGPQTHVFAVRRWPQPARTWRDVNRSCSWPCWAQRASPRTAEGWCWVRDRVGRRVVDGGRKADSGRLWRSPGRGAMSQPSVGVLVSRSGCVAGLVLLLGRVSGLG